MKRIAILLFGISKGKYKHFTGQECIIDYKKSYDNYQKYIFNYFREKDFKLDVYFTTNS